MDFYDRKDVLNSTCLESLRLNIDKIDEKIVGLLNARFSCCIKIAKLKKSLGMSLVDFKRQTEVLNHVNKMSWSEFAEVNELIFSTIMLLSAVCQLE